ncbi:MAG: response regulator [Rhodospirillales bacterium]|nr:response regulator [Rhodospirillales bacterium]
MAKVLIIDDDKVVRELARRMLEPQNHTIFEACDGVEGIQVFQDEAPDVVITDILMPNADGLEVIREIMRLDPDAKIIAISGVGRAPEQAYLKHAQTFGATATLPKPFAPDQLLAVLDEILSTPMPDVASA